MECLAVIHFAHGGPIFPHILGPVVFVTVGLILLVKRKK
jgi:hypothetical protein